MKTTFTKLILLLAFIIGASSPTFAQTPSWQWAKGAGATGGEATTGTVLDASGNLYAVGWYTSANITFGSITLTNPGSYTGEIFVVKYNSAGNVLWAKNYGGVDGDLGSGIAVDASGYVYITGWYTSTSFAMDSYTLTNAAVGTSDIFIAKIDPTGNVVWARSEGGPLADRGLSIAVDASGNVFTTGGYSSASINFGTGNLNNAGSNTNDLFILKYNPSGFALWAKRAGGTGSDVANSVSTDSLGNVYLTGMFASASIDFGVGPLANSATGMQDLFVAKYDGAGIAAWSVRSGGSLDDYGNGIVVRKGNVFVTGGFNSASVGFGSTTLTNASAGTSDVLVAKYDLSGTSAWALRAGDVDSEAGNAVASDANGNVFVSGYFISNSLTIGTNTLVNAGTGYRDLFVAAYSGNSTSLWATTSTAGTYDETAQAISVNALGTDVYIGGTYNSALVTFGTSNISKGCGDDVFVAKLLGPAVGIKETIKEDQLKVYPNPSTGKFTVAAEGQIIFYNVLGEVVLTQKLNEQSQFDFSSQPKGLYLYKVITDKKTAFTGRVVVQ